MKSYPRWAEVSEALGDKVIASVKIATTLARADLTTYRRAFPVWVAEATERGLASWIHDRLWFHLAVDLDGLPRVELVDHEPTREVWVGLNYRIRIKRHHEDGQVNTYPTQTALEFVTQPDQGFLDGLEQWNLFAGYVWVRDEREIGSAVISLHEGDSVIWEERLDEPEGGSDAGPARPVTPEPKPPTIETPSQEAERRTEDE